MKSVRLNMEFLSFFFFFVKLSFLKVNLNNNFIMVIISQHNNQIIKKFKLLRSFKNVFGTTFSKILFKIIFYIFLSF
jgi:flavoprotein